jgi:DNA-binding response OmpR family regulator
MTTTPDTQGDAPAEAPVEVLLYSDDAQTRAEVRLAVGRRAAGDLPAVEWTDVATHGAVVEQAETGRYAALVLDAEAAQAGGLGVCRQLKSEIYDCPPVLVLIARPQDAWLAAWSEADAVVRVPFDPFELRETLAGLLRERSAGIR